jgi:hypothetical protein
LTQSQQAVAIGNNAGQINQGFLSIAIGNNAGQNNQPAQSIVLAANGGVNPITMGFYAAPVRNVTTSNALYYDTSTNEISYGTPTLINGFNFISIPNITNGSTYTIPGTASQRWAGEITFIYSDLNSGDVGMQKYAFYKAPGAVNNGLSNLIYNYNSGPLNVASITFNQTTGTFTFNLIGTQVATADITYYTAV